MRSVIPQGHNIHMRRNTSFTLACMRVSFFLYLVLIMKRIRVWAEKDTEAGKEKKKQKKPSKPE